MTIKKHKLLHKAVDLDSDMPRLTALIPATTGENISILGLLYSQLQTGPGTSIMRNLAKAL
ncbi:MAG: hypothetical protein OSB02_07990 [Rhodospirillaceae bacterium]|nr:hypothetical protein [Rhodospirillaceae bacterium]